jgi:hypothetical protein
MSSIKILNGALDETTLRGGTIILRGVVDPECLKLLKTDDYQREVMPLPPGHRLMQAIKKGEPFPDIELGVRGENFVERNEAIFIQNDVYIIDGLQRVSAAIRYHTLTGNHARVGATVHFNTTREWEKERFDVLNTAGVKVSPNILLRNYRDKHDSVALLYDICDDDTRFVLHKRVSWKQNMTRTDLLTAMMLCRTVMALHAHMGLYGAKNANIMAEQMDVMLKKVGAQNFRMNVRGFYELIDECWGVSMIQYKDVAPQLKGTFLVVMARVLSDHEDFWQLDDKKLFINADLRKKLSQFPLSDPTVVNLASSGGKAHYILYGMLVDHLDRGKIKNKLRKREQPEATVLG